jgi:uncharacterized tellurite resistance protein B-like protein
MNKEKLYEAFGELLYAVAMADGAVQEEERARMKAVLAPFRWGEEVLWSFNYETNHQRPLKDAYAKSFRAICEHGPFSEFYEFVQVLEDVAAASKGIDPEERAMIDRFRQDLQEAFMNNPKIR